MLECIITETKDIEPVVYEWGGVKWVANNDLDPGCEQSFGLVHILPGKTNPSTGTRQRKRSCSCSRASATCAWATGT